MKFTNLPNQKNFKMFLFEVRKKSDYIYKVALVAMLFGLSFVFLYPYMYMLITSVKSYNDIINVTVKWLPNEITLQNYLVAANALDIKHSFVNSLFLTSITTFGHIVSCSFVGYGFARYDFPLKWLWFAIVILTIVVPIQTIIIPLYITYSSLKMLNSFMPFIIPSFVGYGLKGGLFIFLFRQYFIRLPKSLEEAASIDGCGPYKTFMRIAFPSAGPTILVCLVLSMVWHWTDYYEPSIYLSPGSKTILLPQMLPSMYSLIKSMETQGTEWLMKIRFTFHNGVIMAGTTIVTFPLFFTYLFLQKKFMQGVEKSGLVE